MTAKRILYDREARESVGRGVAKLARAVRATLGPRGRLALLARTYGAPNATKDGVTVAKEIELADPYENMGAQLLREVASKTSQDAGDGTTTATVLAEAIFQEGLRHVTGGGSASALKRGVEKAVAAVVEDLKSRSTPVSGRKQWAEVATIAANGDRELGEKIADALEKVGKDGAITVEEGKSLSTEVEVVGGMQLDRGWLSSHFVTDPATMKAELENPFILIHEKKISAAADLVPLLEEVARAGAPLVIVSEEVEGDALATLVVNKLRGILRCCAVKAPGFGDRRAAMLEDIAVLTGGKAIVEALGVKLETVALSDLGRAKKVVVEKETTTIEEGAGDRSAVQGRLALLRKERDDATSDYDKEKLDERIARLAGGVAKVLVGGATEVEVKERKARVDDAVHAVRAAVAEGILPGGGVALLRAEAAVDRLGLSGDEAVGAQIVKRALSAPLRWIAANAGENPEITAQGVREHADPAAGYDADARVVRNLLEAGIVDPTKVVRSAIQNAAGAAGLLLSLEAAIAEVPEEEAAAR
ncbi:MAG: chaperonin GroEL [Planctomycetales bacterium]|nr:chaperonin GroEL [Planctomycetales bacterium]